MYLINVVDAFVFSGGRIGIYGQAAESVWKGPEASLEYGACVTIDL